MNTRFNPTANGQLHLGHLYLILLNQRTAKKSGGRFLVRFDDDQPHWIQSIGKQGVADSCQSIIEDLDWMGIDVDGYSYQSREREANEQFIKDLPGIRPLSVSGYGAPPMIVSCDRPYPYVPYLTAIKVAQDYREQVDCVIRGDDLISEFSLYCYFCERLSIPIPTFFYVPKLLYQGDDLTDVSKTRGNFRVRDLRAKGLTPQTMVSILATACLKVPKGEWSFENIKQIPALTSEDFSRWV
ncbi:MAG: glutamate--tRNA ligase [Schlesneria sp.]|nr:glutamate--tRNA ligase [Schlesneria sp.]